MQLIIFILAYPFIWLISILPFPMLYAFSDFVCFLVYRVFGYRKKVVRNNLAMTLPHLSDNERLLIEKKFYSHMCDMFLEMVKTMGMSQKQMEKRYRFTNLDLYLEMEKKGKSVILLCAHYASYEWLVSMNLHISFEGYGVYKKINNRYFDKMVKNIRSRFRTHLITTRETIPTIEKNHKIGKLGIFGLASDQSPQASRAYHWAPFMGIETPVHTGAEMLAKRFDMNMIFLKSKKIKRGHYEATFELMAENPKEVPNYEISEDFLRRVEKQILEAPEFYLWTHKRWKHRKSDQ